MCVFFCSLHSTLHICTSVFFFLLRVLVWFGCKLVCNRCDLCILMMRFCRGIRNREGGREEERKEDERYGT